MESNELVKTLAQLHTELSKTDRVDAESLAQLRQLTNDIGRLLDQQIDTTADDADEVTSGLKDLMLKFESEHPQFSMSLGKVADALASLGI